MAFVVGMLTLAESDLHLRQAFFIDKKHERHDGLTGVFGRFVEFPDLAFGEQQFAVAFGFMVGITAEAIFGDMHLLDVHLSVLYGTITIHQGRFAFADRFDLGAE